jgi:hypothetical protein
VLLWISIALAISVPRTADQVRELKEKPAKRHNHALKDWIDELEPERRLVFVDISTYDALSALLVNRPDLVGENLVAVYRFPEQNRAVLDAFPGRTPYLLRWGGREWAPDMRFYDVQTDSIGPPQVYPYTKGRYARGVSRSPREDSSP